MINNKTRSPKKAKIQRKTTRQDRRLTKTRIMQRNTRIQDRPIRSGAAVLYGRYGQENEEDEDKHEETLKAGTKEVQGARTKGEDKYRVGAKKRSEGHTRKWANGEMGRGTWEARGKMKQDKGTREETQT